MKVTLDLTNDEADCVLRALTAHITATTDALRSRAAAQLSRTEVEHMYADIRTAATLAGRLPIRPIRLEQSP